VGVIHKSAVIYTFEAETRPLLFLDASVLDLLQEAAKSEKGMGDPIFFFDEGLSQLGACFQVDAFSRDEAIELGCKMFTAVLSSANITAPNVIEQLTVQAD